jgi:purine-binding chemotaxis protein CheW
MSVEHVKETSEPSMPLVNHDRGGKYVTFFLGSEEYGLPILAVREIIGMVEITPIPQTPTFVRGVVNLRGNVIPIIDLRRKFSMESAGESRENCIIVVRAHGADTGVVVDRMSEVAHVEGSEIQEPPPVGAEVNTDFILGIDKSGGKVRLLLDIERVISSHELLNLQGIAAEVLNQ